MRSIVVRRYYRVGREENEEKQRVKGRGQTKTEGEGAVWVECISQVYVHVCTVTINYAPATAFVSPH